MTLAVTCALTACASAPLERRPSARVTYWESIAALEADQAVAFAGSPEQRAFATALRSMMAGRIGEAEESFFRLKNTGRDSVIRLASRIIHTAALQYQDKWAELAAAVRSDESVRTDLADRAGIEAWALAFRGVPPKLFTFGAQSVELPVTVSSVGTPLIPVRVGRRVYHFWLDTGSSMTMLASDVAEDLSLVPMTRDSLEIVTSTGRVSAVPALLPEIGLGLLSVRNVPTMIVHESLMQMKELKPGARTPPIKIDGIIGFDIIRQLDIEVDYGERSVRIREPGRRGREGTAERNMFWVGMPVVRVQSRGGLPLHFGLDTGAQLTFVTETLLDKLQIQSPRIESRRIGGLGGEISLRTAVLPDLRVSVRGHPIIFRGAVVRAPVYQVLASLDGVLGSDVWNSGIVRMDMTNGIFTVRSSRPD